MLPVEVLLAALAQTAQSPPEKASLRVLDLCAAPGSKSTQLGVSLGGEGHLIVNELDAQRVRRLRAVLIRAGLGNFLVSHTDGRKIGEAAPGAFDAVLVDAPCSNEGGLRSDSKLMEQWAAPGHEKRLESDVASLQFELLQSGWRALRPGGYLVYSTCTLNSFENEAICRRFVSAEASARQLDVHELLHLPCEADKDSDTFHVWPHMFDTEGFFVSCFTKDAALAGTVASASSSRTAVATGSSLRPLLGPVRVQLQQAVHERLGSWPEVLRSVREDASGTIWAVPEMWSGMEPLRAYMEEPGIQVARRRAAGGSFELSDELLLLAAGGPSAPALRLSTEELLSLVARAEGSLVALNAAMDRAGEGGAIAAESALQSIRVARLRPDAFSYTNLINAYGRSSDLAGAAGALGQMREARLPPALASYNALISACARTGAVEQAEEVLSDLQQQRLEPNVVSYTALMKAHVSAGSADGAQQVCDEMRQQSVALNHVSYHTLMSAYAAQGSIGSSQQTLEAMAREGLEPNVVSYSILINAHAKGGDLAGAKAVLDDMRNERVDIGRVTYETLIGACISEGDVEGAVELFGEMVESDVQADTATYASFVRRVMLSGNAEGARRMQLAMRRTRQSGRR